MRIFLLMSTYSHLYSSGGTIAKATYDLLKSKGYDVRVISSTNQPNMYIQGEVTYFPVVRKVHIGTILTRIGLSEDYLDKWVKFGLNYFVHENLQKNDIIIATSVGEIGTLKLASMLKRKYGCKYIAHFHDPIKHAKMNGLKYDWKFHFSRESVEKKYLENVDYVVTCCDTYKFALSSKYPFLNDKIVNAHFGWIQASKIELKLTNFTSKIRIAYGGNFGWPQSPEILAEAAQGLNNVEVVFIGNYKKYKPMHKYMSCPNVKFINRMDHTDFLNYMRNNVDIAFLSLSKEYFSACIPAKLYDYINIGLPILASLPNGEAKSIINDNQYGIAVNINVGQLRNAISKFYSPDVRQTFINNIECDKEIWDINKQLNPFVEVINNLSLI